MKSEQEDEGEQGQSRKKGLKSGMYLPLSATASLYEITLFSPFAYCHFLKE